jgi:hypothetical protein
VIQGFIGGGGVQPLTLFNLINLTEAVITGPDSIAGMMRRNSFLTKTATSGPSFLSPGPNRFFIGQKQAGGTPACREKALILS